SSLSAAEKESVDIVSDYGYTLKGVFIKNPKDSNKTIILLHGIGRDKEWSIMKYAPLFFNDGFNIFAYDARNHGESGGEYPTYGAYESEDLEKCIEYIKSKRNNDTIGLHGESMGAAVSLIWAGKYDNNGISFLIEDCGYSDLYNLYYERLADYQVPKILRPVILCYTSFFCKMLAGFSLSDISPIKNIGNIKLPVLFIHGNADNFVLPEMAKGMFENKIGGKEIYLVPGAGHAKAINVDVKRYDQVTAAFYDNFIKKQ
ncbi:MAG: alpha/beta hydrolase, partial [Selenomonadaceae bacterium]